MSTHTRGPRTPAPAAPRPTASAASAATAAAGSPLALAALVGSRAAGWGVEHNAGMCPAATAPAARPANAEPGYYVRHDGVAIKVVSQQEGTRTYGKALRFPTDGSRPSWNYEPGLGISVADLRPMTAADAAETRPEPRPLHLLLRAARRRDAQRGGVRADRLRRDLRQESGAPVPQGRRGPARLHGGARQVMDLASKMLTVAVYAQMDGSLRVVHEACGASLVEDAVEVRLSDLVPLVDAHRCGGV